MGNLTNTFIRNGGKRRIESFEQAGEHKLDNGRRASGVAPDLAASREKSRSPREAASRSSRSPRHRVTIGATGNPAEAAPWRRLRSACRRASASPPRPGRARTTRISPPHSTAPNCPSRARRWSRRSPTGSAAQRGGAPPPKPRCAGFSTDFAICPRPWRCNARAPGSSVRSTAGSTPRAVRTPRLRGWAAPSRRWCCAAASPTCCMSGIRGPTGSVETS